MIEPLPIGDFDELMRAEPLPVRIARWKLQLIGAVMRGEEFIMVDLTPNEFELLLTLVTPERAAELEQQR